MNIVNQNSDIEQLSCTDSLKKETSQTCIQVPEKKQSWWTVKKIVVISITTTLVLGALGVILWYFLKDIGHNYYQGRINNYRTLARNCVSQQHDQIIQEPVCYNQSIDSSIITLDVQPDVIFQALSIINLTLIYDNGTSIYYGGFNFTEALEIDNQDIKELTATGQVDDIPIFKTEVDPKTNTVLKVYVPIGLSEIVIQSAMQQLMHSNTAIQDPDNMTSITGINQINGAINKPRFDFNHSHLPKGVSVLKNVTKDDIVQRVDGLESTLNAQVKFNKDGEVVSSRINGYQNVFQEPLTNNNTFKFNLITTTSQETILVSSSDIQEIIDVVNKIMLIQNVSIYDSSNITLAYGNDDENKSQLIVQKSRMIQSTNKPPQQDISFIYVQDKIIASQNVFGRNISLNLNMYGYRQSDSYVFYSQLDLSVNGLQSKVLLQETQILKDKNFEKSFNAEYNNDIVSTQYPIVGVPVQVNIKSLFSWGYKIKFQVQNTALFANMEINGRFGLSAQVGVATSSVRIGLGVDGTIADIKLPLATTIDTIKKTAVSALQLQFSNDLRVYAFFQLWQFTKQTTSKCPYLPKRTLCIPPYYILTCNFSDPTYLIQDTFVQTQIVIQLQQRTLGW